MIKGKYNLKIIQRGKPKTCNHLVRVVLAGSYSPLHTNEAIELKSKIPPHAWYGYMLKYRHQS